MIKIRIKFYSAFHRFRQQKASEKIFNYAEKSINITLEVNELSEYVIKSQYDLR